MAGYRKQIGSHIFYNAQDYEDALDDERLIEELMKFAGELAKLAEPLE